VAKAHRKLTKEKSGYARYGGGPGRSIKRLLQKRAPSARLTGADETLRFADGVGNAVDERPGLSEMLAKCKRGEVDTVVVEDFARLSRSADKAASVVSLPQKAGVKLRVASKRQLHRPY